MINYTYYYEDESNEWMVRKGDDGSVIQFGAVETNPMYAEFLASGAIAAPYVAPPASPEPTPEEKLAKAGLTVNELKKLLGLNS